MATSLGLGLASAHRRVEALSGGQVHIALPTTTYAELPGGVQLQNLFGKQLKYCVMFST